MGFLCNYKFESNFLKFSKTLSKFFFHRFEFYFTMPSMKCWPFAPRAPSAAQEPASHSSRRHQTMADFLAKAPRGTKVLTGSNKSGNWIGYWRPKVGSADARFACLWIHRVQRAKITSYNRSKQAELKIRVNANVDSRKSNDSYPTYLRERLDSQGAVIDWM